MVLIIAYGLNLIILLKLLTAEMSAFTQKSYKKVMFFLNCGKKKIFFCNVVNIFHKFE